MQEENVRFIRAPVSCAEHHEHDSIRVASYMKAVLRRTNGTVSNINVVISVGRTKFKASFHRCCNLMQNWPALTDPERRRRVLALCSKELPSLQFSALGCDQSQSTAVVSGNIERCVDCVEDNHPKMSGGSPNSDSNDSKGPDKSPSAKRPKHSPSGTRKQRYKNATH